MSTAATAFFPQKHVADVPHSPLWYSPEWKWEDMKDEVQLSVLSISLCNSTLSCEGRFAAWQSLYLRFFGSLFLSDTVTQICTYLQPKQKACGTDVECGVGHRGEG